MRHFQIAGTSLESLLPLSYGNILKGTRLIAEPNGNNVKNWTIRSQAPKFRYIYLMNMEKVQRLDGSGSEIIW